MQQVDRFANKKEKDIMKRLYRYYALSLQDIQNEIGKYERKGILTQNHMMQYNRLANLEKEIAREMQKLNSKVTVHLKAGLGELYEESYYRMGFMFEKEVQAKLAFTQLPTKALEGVIENPMDRIGWVTRNRQNHQVLTQRVQEELFRGLAQGKGYRDISRMLKDRREKAVENDIDRIVRTEAHRVRESAKLDSMEHAQKQGVVAKKRWVATLDGRTRDTHQSVDGQEVEVNEDFEVNGATGKAPGMTGEPAEDINCRCTMITVIEGFEPTERRARGEGVIPYQNYDEWRDARVNG